MMDLQERLTNGKTVIMDGGVSTEIERKGLAMNGDVWSGAAHIDHGDIVLAVHEDYMRAGAEIITANTFATARHVLEGKGMGDDFEMINRAAVEVAQQASGDSNGIRVRIQKRNTARASAEEKILSELEQAGVGRDAVFESSELID